jgi:hypothetical protein
MFRDPVALALMIALGNNARLTTEDTMTIESIKYEEFLLKKAQLNDGDGFAPIWMPNFLFDFQSHIVDWAIRRGRAAIFADCGMGKTPMQLVWAENVRRHTNKPVLIITPLAVSQQTVEEAEKFGIEAKVSREGSIDAPIIVTNYERLHYFRSSDFGGVVCDESSAIKSFTGKTRAEVTEFLRLHRYRLLCTATAAPNDYIELGTSSEALGEMGARDMLSHFFKNDQNNGAGGVGRRAWRNQGGGELKWRFKGHAEIPFWKWVSSWARAIRKPSDFGFNDESFKLPKLIEREHLVKAATLPPGCLFEVIAQGLTMIREEQRRTITERCERMAELCQTKDPVVVWCNLNDEGKLLSKLLPDFVEVSGSSLPELKEEAFNAFRRGEIRGLITKSKIGAWGMNWQHCAHTVLFPSYSYEQYYQLVRRFWRFGQTRNVTVDIVTTESGHDIMESLTRKAEQTDRMFSSLVEHMNNARQISLTKDTRKMEVPKWL